MGTSSRKRLSLVGFAFIAAVLIAFVALAARSPSLAAGEGRANAGPIIAIVHAIEIAGIAVELLALLILIVIVRFARRRDDDNDDLYEEPVRAHWLVRLISSLLPVLLFTALIVAFVRRRPVDQPLDLGQFGGAPPASGGSDGLFGQVMANLGLGWWEILIAVAVAVVGFVAFLRAFRAVPAAPPDEHAEDREGTALAKAITAGLHDARLEADPRRAVIAAYATLEQMLAAQGFPRRDVEAPLEYMTRLFAQRNVRGDALSTLTQLFELARFSHHVITPATKERAIAALTVIERDLQTAPAP